MSLPLDIRATNTLQELLTPILALDNLQLVLVMLPAFAHTIELRSKIMLDSGLSNIILEVLTADITNGRPYYSREDIIAWNKTHKHFSPIEPEILIINGDFYVITDQEAIGVAFAVLNYPQVLIGSSMGEFDAQRIVDYVVAYSGYSNSSASQRLQQRPYSLQLNNTTIYFSSPTVFTGVTFIARVLNLPNKGKGLLYNNYQQLTRERLIELN